MYIICCKSVTNTRGKINLDIKIALRLEYPKKVCYTAVTNNQIIENKG
jgi:hypothetical protein